MIRAEGFLDFHSLGFAVAFSSKFAKGVAFRFECWRCGRRDSGGFQFPKIGPDGSDKMHSERLETEEFSWKCDWFLWPSC